MKTISMFCEFKFSKLCFKQLNISNLVRVFYTMFLIFLNRFPIKHGLIFLFHTAVQIFFYIRFFYKVTLHSNCVIMVLNKYHKYTIIKMLLTQVSIKNIGSIQFL